MTTNVRSYVRPMHGWWRRDPYFKRYMIREGSSVFLASYALILLVGLLRLTQGEEAYEAWRAHVDPAHAINQNKVNSTMDYFGVRKLLMPKGAVK